MIPDKYRQIIETGRKAYQAKHEADKAKLATLGLTDLTLEEYLLFDRITEILSGAFLEFLKSGALDPKKEPADAAPAAG
jgi:hypothetical protein